MAEREPSITPPPEMENQGGGTNGTTGTTGDRRHPQGDTESVDAESANDLTHLYDGTAGLGTPKKSGSVPAIAASNQVPGSGLQLASDPQQRTSDEATAFLKYARLVEPTATDFFEAGHRFQRSGSKIFQGKLAVKLRQILSGAPLLVQILVITALSNKLEPVTLARVRHGITTLYGVSDQEIASRPLGQVIADHCRPDPTS